MKNTKIELGYRDGSNYKAHQTVILAGQISDDDIKVIQSKLEDGIFIIANQLGLPTPSFQFAGKDGWPNDDLDHVWTSLPDFEDGVPTVESLLVDDPATEDQSVAGMMAAIKEVKWDVAAEWMRMQEAA